MSDCADTFGYNGKRHVGPDQTLISSHLLILQIYPIRESVKISAFEAAKMEFSAGSLR